MALLAIAAFMALVGLAAAGATVPVVQAQVVQAEANVMAARANVRRLLAGEEPKIGPRE